MEQQGQEVTPEQFKIRVLKQRFAEALANAEETISELIVANQQQRQAIEERDAHIAGLEEKLNAQEAEATTDIEG